MKPGVITQVRDLMPIRPLNQGEALGLAERQALAFLRLAGITDPAVPEAAISELPRLEVHRAPALPVSGLAHWSRGRWLILLKASEAPARQRFSLGHELKHILDHRFVDTLYAEIPDQARAEFIERVCDYFAACLLMPRPWVKRAWTSGVQGLPALASRFGVSQSAMQVRLNQLGLVDRASRCDRPGLLESIDDIVRTARYHRTTAPLA